MHTSLQSTPKAASLLASDARPLTRQALMSSKPTNGINHKQFGVTSEGVAVNLDVGLRETGRHPEQVRFELF